MAKEKEYNKRMPMGTEEEISAYKKKSKTSSKSNSNKRSNHKHDYKPVIIEGGFNNADYHWGKRCEICGRVDDSGWLKPNAKEGLVKKREKVSIDSSTYTFETFYTFWELRKLFPDTLIIKYDYKRRQYIEVKSQ